MYSWLCATILNKLLGKETKRFHFIGEAFQNLMYIGILVNLKKKIWLDHCYMYVHMNSGFQKNAISRTILSGLFSALN